MAKTDNPIFTIGHSTHTLEAFCSLLQQHQVSALADVRSVAYSRFNVQFNRDLLADALNKAGGIEYVYLGREPGGRSTNPECYEDGRIRYDRVATTELFQCGLESIIHGSDRHCIALMCAEKEPLDCHRTLLVSQALDERGLEVAHIHAGG